MGKYALGKEGRFGTAKPLPYIRIRFKLRHPSHLLSYVSLLPLSHFVLSCLLPLCLTLDSFTGSQDFVCCYLEISGYIIYPCRRPCLLSARFFPASAATYKWQLSWQPSDHPLLNLRSVFFYLLSHSPSTTILRMEFFSGRRRRSLQEGI